MFTYPVRYFRVPPKISSRTTGATRNPGWRPPVYMSDVRNPLMTTEPTSVSWWWPPEAGTRTGWLSYSPVALAGWTSPLWKWVPQVGELRVLCGTTGTAGEGEGSGSCCSGKSWWSHVAGGCDWMRGDSSSTTAALPQAEIHHLTSSFSVICSSLSIHRLLVYSILQQFPPRLVPVSVVRFSPWIMTGGRGRGIIGSPHLFAFFTYPFRGISIRFPTFIYSICSLL
jgi:hypothetical protein